MNYFPSSKTASSVNLNWSHLSYKKVHRSQWAMWYLKKVQILAGNTDFQYDQLGVYVKKKEKHFKMHFRSVWKIIIEIYYSLHIKTLGFCARVRNSENDRVPKTRILDVQCWRNGFFLPNFCNFWWVFQSGESSRHFKTL